MKKVLAVSALILFILCGFMVLKSTGVITDKNKKAPAAAEAVKETPSEELSPEAEVMVSEPAEEAPPEEMPPEEIPSEETPSEEASLEEEEIRDPLPEYDEILAVNPYVSGWLKIDGSNIDAPVVYTPKSQNYFLHRDLSGNDRESGTLFIAAIWRDGYHNTLIYGHNMKDGSGFGSLGKYSSKAYALDHRTIRFDTLYESREYELLGAFYSAIEETELETKEDRAERDKAVEEEGIKRKLEEEAEEKPSEESGEGKGAEEEPSKEEPEEIPTLTLKDLHLDEDPGNVDVYRMEKDQDMKNGDFRYYYFTDLTYKEDYDYYVENVKKNSIYDTGVSAEWGDELLTLSTCSYHTANGRFVIVAKRV